MFETIQKKLCNVLMAFGVRYLIFSQICIFGQLPLVVSFITLNLIIFLMCDVLFQLSTLYMPHTFQNQLLSQPNMALPQYPVSCSQFVWD